MSVYLLNAGRRHAHARRCENKQIQDDQAADDARGQSEHQELCKYWRAPQHVLHDSAELHESSENARKIIRDNIFKCWYKEKIDRLQHFPSSDSWDARWTFSA